MYANPAFEVISLSLEYITNRGKLFLEIQRRITNSD